MAAASAVSTDELATGPAPLAARARLLHLLGAWTLLWLGNPGVTAPGLAVTCASLGWIWLAWGTLAPTRPGKAGWRGARLWIDWLAAAVGLSAQCFWSTKVLWLTLLAVAIVPGLYYALAAATARLLATRCSAGLAFAAAFASFEVLRTQLEPPFAFGWMRVAHHYAGPDGWLAPVQVLGAAGAGFLLLLGAGGLAQAWRGRVAAATRTPGLVLAGVGWGAWVLAGLGATTIETRVAGRALLVQPAFEQRRKMNPLSAREMFGESLQLTRAGLERHGPVDLVAWGETMLPYLLAEPELEAAVAGGARAPDWARYQPRPEDLRTLRENEDAILGVLQSQVGALLPPGVVFVAGVEQLCLRDAAVRRSNSIVAWKNGQRVGQASKRHLVPGAESLAGLERIELVRAGALALAGYLPDLVPDVGAGLIDLPLEAGVVRTSATVCFDNSFEDVYVAATRAGAELHLVASNEAWYEESFEYDQMLAFSRVAAVETGRAMVRATNSGLTALVRPDGQAEVLRVGGRDRMVAGSLAVDLPVPLQKEQRTLYLRLREGILLSLVLAPWLLFLLPLAAQAVLRRRRD